MKALLRFSWVSYVSECCFALPASAIMMFYCISYILHPIKNDECFALAMIILFVISLLDGFFSYGLQCDSMEQIIVAKTGGMQRYYVGMELFIAQLAMIYSVCFMIYPCVGSVFKITLLERPFRPADMLFLFVRYFFVSLCGYELGSLFKPRITRMRGLSVALMLLLVAGSFTQQFLVAGSAVFEWFGWIFPPLADAVRLTREYDYFYSPEMIYTTVRLILYTFLILGGKVMILNRK